MKYFSILLLCLLPVFSYAAEAQDVAKDPVLEKRMIGLAENLRCLVCQNESLASSHAELAEDLRREVREQMQKGLSDQEIIDYLVSRYGDFVLYDPPVKKSTLVLWYSPFVLLLIGVGLLFLKLRKRKSEIVEIKLSVDDTRRAAELLSEPPEAGQSVADLSNQPNGQSARFPDGTTSHSTRLPKDSSQVAGYLPNPLPMPSPQSSPASGRGGERERQSSTPAGDGANVSLRDARIKDSQA